MGAYYNEHDPKAAAWLRELIARGLIADGEVDERSIEDVTPADLRGFTQCHFFAGIGGWSLALRLAGWPDDRPVWTGSCPCQPFSTAGKGAGTADERHLWPAFYWLIRQCRPANVFGEQVASKGGREWLAGVRVDLEGVAYEVGASDLCAAGTGALHPRQRLYWVAHPLRERWHERGCQQRECSPATETGRCGFVEICRGAGNDARSYPSLKLTPLARRSAPAMESPSWVAIQRRGVGLAEPQPPPLAHGIPARVVRLRGYGNAIVPQVAAEFIRAAEEARHTDLMDLI